MSVCLHVNGWEDMNTVRNWMETTPPPLYIATIHLLLVMLLVSTSYRLQATAELPETVLAVATALMEWHSPHMTMTMTCNCAQSYKGGWWYNYCMHSTLSGIYHHDTTPRGGEVVYWETFTTSTRYYKMHLKYFPQFFWIIQCSI